MEDFKLIAFKCPSCDSGLGVEINDNVVYCSSCGNGYEITDDKLVPIEVNFAKPLLQGTGYHLPAILACQFLCKD